MNYCTYCFLPTNLVECLDCSKFFCNNQTKSSTSHIISHLIKLNHNRIKIINKIECQNCYEQNVFLLAYGSSKNENIICRKCVENKIKEIMKEEFNCDQILNPEFIEPEIKMKETNLNISPLIKDRYLKGHFYNYSNDINNDNNRIASVNGVYLNSNQLSSLQIENKLKLPSTKKIYTSTGHVEILSELIKAEADFERNLKEQMTQFDVNIKWSENYKKCSFFMNVENTGFKIKNGDKVVV
ncbi:ATP-dependent helicase upf1 [Dictyocoela muelleri]|nr:ATP-dependent helicase upf1 [Dictyocoela muelleri]